MENSIEIFIAFDEADSSNGWISDFQKYLHNAAEELLGEKPKIKSMKEFRPDLIEAKKDYLLLVMLSEESCKSVNMTNQIHFFKQTFPSDDKSGNSKTKIIKILKDPIQYYNQPAAVRDLDGFELFFPEILTDEPFEKRNETQVYSDYWIQIAALTYRIFDFSFSEKEKNKSIYLANCSRELMAYRQIIKMELVREGYSVLPNKTYPDDVELAQEMIRNDMENTIMSIHLIGPNLEDNPYQSFSLSNIQYHTASAKPEQEFIKLIWTKPDLEFLDEEQKIFFDQIKRDSENKENSFILESTLEELKDSIRSFLKKKEVFGSTSINPEPLEKMQTIYVLYDYVDKELGKKLVGPLKRGGYKALFPEFNNDVILDAKAHKENLEKFDIALVICHKANEKWLQMKFMEMIKSRGYGRQKPVLTKLIITADAVGQADAIQGFKFPLQIIPSPDVLHSMQVDEILQNTSSLLMTKYD